jgi:hypothetical protein
MRSERTEKGYQDQQTVSKSARGLGESKWAVLWMCERYTILVRGDSRRMIGIIAVTGELLEVSITLEPRQGWRKGLRCGSSMTAMSSRRSGLSSPAQ